MEKQLEKQLVRFNRNPCSSSFHLPLFCPTKPEEGEKKKRGSDSMLAHRNITDQYHTTRGPIPMNLAQQQIRQALGLDSRQKSGYPHRYHNEEKIIEDFVTGPGRAHGRPGDLHLFPIATSGELHHFRYDERIVPWASMMREPHPNERANVMGSSNAKPRNSPGATRAITRVANGQNIVVSVVDHPEGDTEGFVGAPIEPINRQGRQEAERYLDKELRRAQSFPPRGIDSEVASKVEQRHKKVRESVYPEYRGSELERKAPAW
ncbi:hypothetical protein QBC46DRAFT_416362 [Diplogelasinospora grovesii]|uniref:Uncharacterized protein n=1 Tax=Diplogelasinospora grovesii TaxID=303347 RepID=A0AAN6S1U6_9PEZI|nr:hypothetical protein QBC46DRAFT_416362 [Diplogelasinospora grovesii]